MAKNHPELEICAGCGKCFHKSELRYNKEMEVFTHSAYCEKVVEVKNEDYGGKLYFKLENAIKSANNLKSLENKIYTTKQKAYK